MEFRTVFAVLKNIHRLSALRLLESNHAATNTSGEGRGNLVVLAWESQEPFVHGYEHSAINGKVQQLSKLALHEFIGQNQLPLRVLGKLHDGEAAVRETKYLCL